MIQSAFFFALLIAASLAFLAVLAPFFEPILWATTLAILFQPVQRYLLKFFGERVSVAALSTLAIILITVIVPALFISVAVAREGIGLYQAIASGEIDISGPLTWAQNAWPSLMERGEGLGVNLEEIKQKLSTSALQGSQWVASHLLAFGQNTLRFAIMFFLMLYLLFFFLRDGKQIINTVIKVLPIGDERERHLLAKFAEVSRATIKGTLVVGMVQGILGGIVFAFFGNRICCLLGGCHDAALCLAGSWCSDRLVAGSNLFNCQRYALAGCVPDCIRRTGYWYGRQCIAPHSGWPRH